MKLLFFVAAAAALPNVLVGRDDAGKHTVDIALCRHEGLQDCDIYTVSKKDCHDVPDDINNHILSVFMTGGKDCTYYNKKSCRGRNFTQAGKAYMLDAKFQDKISSYMCT